MHGHEPLIPWLPARGDHPRTAWRVRPFQIHIQQDVRIEKDARLLIHMPFQQAGSALLAQIFLRRRSSPGTRPTLEKMLDRLTLVRCGGRRAPAQLHSQMLVEFPLCGHRQRCDGLFDLDECAYARRLARLA
jgi:hypothetical protein